MSDQQKGLIGAVAEVFLQAETRVCARHVYCNFRGVFGGSLELRKQFWMTAKSNTENDFLARIEGIRELSNDAAEDLMKRNYRKWCRAFYTPLSCCDSVDNNMSEVFNAFILKFRHKPIITMLEDIRESLMERLHKKKDMMKEDDMSLCPRIHQQLEKHKIWARGWTEFWDGGFCYGVREGATQTKYVVNLANRTCSCNAWQLSGIPCKHAIVAIWNKVEQPKTYVNDYFRKSTYALAYQHLLEPLNGPQEWPNSDQTISAPPLKKVNNRPKKNRRQGVGEVSAKGKVRRTGLPQQCTTCGLSGHNKRSCKNAPTEQHYTASSSREEPVLSEATTAEVSASGKTSKKGQHQQCTNCGLLGHNKRSCNKAINSDPSATTSQSTSIPMHNRGVGVYTYPNGIQRIATPCTNLNPTHQRPAAFYSDFEGEQTIYSISQEYPISQSQPEQNSQQQQTISTQALQNQARAKQLEISNKKH